MILGAAVYTFGARLLLHYPTADIWQHLAAINAIAEDPFHPTNPFVQSYEPTRLFGPLWVLVGMLCNWLGLQALTGFWVGGVINLCLLALGIWILGTALFDGPKGAFALLLAMFGGWVWPVNFTGFHTPLTLLSSAGYPAITVLACSLILWGLSLRWLHGANVGPLIVAVSCLGFIVHPLGMAVGLAGCMSLALFDSFAVRDRRFSLVGLVGLGTVAASAWPYFNPWTVLLSASSPNWGVGIDFYNPLWIIKALLPAIVGLPFLFRRELWPFLFLLLACTIGFLLGTTEYFVAGHRLLSWMALLLQIGLANFLLRIFGERTRLSFAVLAITCGVLVVQSVWTFRSLANMQRQAAQQGSLLEDARGVLEKTHGGFAGYISATFPLTALGKRVLSTSFAEPLVADMPERQLASQKLFELSDRGQRISQARTLGVRYLVADIREIPSDMDARLSHQAVSVTRSGNLVRFDLY